MIFDASFVVSLCMIGFLASALATALIRERRENRVNQELRAQNLRLGVAQYRVDPFDPADLLREAID